MEAVRADIEAYLQKAKVGITGANAIAAREGARSDSPQRRKCDPGSDKIEAYHPGLHR